MMQQLAPTRIILVYLSNGTAKNVRVDSHTTVQRVVDVVLAGLGLDQFSTPHFALRLAPVPSVPGATKAQSCFWLHPAMRMPQVDAKYVGRCARAKVAMRYELRIRFVPRDMREMYQTQMAAFLYFYEQLANDYVDHVSWKIDQERAMELGALMLRKRFPNVTASTVEKKLDFKAIEQEGGLLRYFPEFVVAKAKKKQLQKAVIAVVKKMTVYSELECVFRFMHQLSKIVRYDAEVFKAAIGVGWTQPIELYVGDRAGISYKTENSTALICLGKLQHVVDVSVRKLDAKGDKALVRLRFSAQTTPLVFTLPTLDIAESLAHLIDGYQMMLSQQPSAWSVHDLFLLENGFKPKRAHTLSPTMSRRSTMTNGIQPPPHLQMGPPRVRAVPLYPSQGTTPSQQSHSGTSGSDDYAKSISSETGDWNLDRSRIRIEEFIGDGLFGNVYRGSYVDQRRKKHAVAIKVCREDGEVQDLQTSNKFLLDEAYTMRQFNHEHIIRLMGICSGPSHSDDSESDSGIPVKALNNNVGDPHHHLASVWIVMELAPLGELRQYLQREREVVDLSVQILFARQLASAVAYLHSRQFVHRDIAARNCLVSTPRCVKLSDFGMSKLLEDEQVYTSTSGKLPIKWMAPESLNLRRFGPASDVYSLAVCIWEILEHGVKPWQGIRNQDVIKRIEAGETLPRPDGCPWALYDMLRAMWVIDEATRMTAVETVHFLEHLLEEIDAGKAYFDLSVPDFHVLRRKASGVQSLEAQERRLSVPVLSVDVSQVPTSALWRALENQKRQCEEDERWLEEEEKNLCPLSSSTSTASNGYHSHPPPEDHNHTQHRIYDECNYIDYVPRPIISLPKNYELDRAEDGVHHAVLRVVQAVALLTKVYTPHMPNADFMDHIRAITNELSSLFAASVGDLADLNEVDRKRVELVEGLLGSDLKNLNGAVEAVVKEDHLQDVAMRDVFRREVLKIAHILAVNCKHFLDSVDEGRIRSGVARLHCRSESISK